MLRTLRVNHAFMPICLKVVSVENFKDFLASASYTMKFSSRSTKLSEGPPHGCFVSTLAQYNFLRESLNILGKIQVNPHGGDFHHRSGCILMLNSVNILMSEKIMTKPTSQNDGSYF